MAKVDSNPSRRQDRKDPHFVLEYGDGLIDYLAMWVEMGYL